MALTRRVGAATNPRPWQVHAARHPRDRVGDDLRVVPLAVRAEVVGSHLAGGWTYGETRDVRLKKHPYLVRWDRVQADPEAFLDLLDKSLRSLMRPLYFLRSLGFRPR